MNSLNKKSMVSEMENLFDFTVSDAKKLIKNFHSEMSKGLRGRGQKSSLAMIPSFVDMPTGSEKGRFLALDLGGTNFRVLLVALSGRGKVRVISDKKFRLKERDIIGEGERLFDFIADSIKKFMRANNIDEKKHRDLGYTFSFPINQTSIAKGVLLCWNKGFSARNVVGKDVVDLMDQALHRKEICNIRISALLNDTVGTFAARRYSDKYCDLGVILGTGTNACYPEKIGRIKKQKRLETRSGYMAINMEWGNFNKINCTIYDKEVDRISFNPGRQRLEKMVSGLYLGQIIQVVLIDLIKNGALFNGKIPAGLKKPGSFITEYVSIILGDKTRELKRIGDLLAKLGVKGSLHNSRVLVKNICRIVTMRSAYISASAIAGVLLWMDPGIKKRHTAAIDGSLFEKTPEYGRYMKEILKKILKEKADKVKLVLAKDGSGKGAAIAAATASR